MTESVYILWPEERVVNKETIRRWFDDAVANGHIAPQEDWPRADGGIETLAGLLHDAGLITLCKDCW